MFSNVFTRAALFTLFSIIASDAFAVPSRALASEEIRMMITLTSGTPVSLYLNEAFSAEEVSVGNSLDFTVRSNVVVNGKVVIAAGATATGWVKKVKNACNGQCSEVTISVEEVQAVDGQMVRLRSTPHIIKAPCCGGEANANIGGNVRANVLNDIKINA